MARAKRNGNGRLDETVANLNQSVAILNQAMATLAQNQAGFLGRLAATDAQIAESNRRMDETNRINSERFARIEAILIEHSRILSTLPDAMNAIRDKIGFKTPGSAKTE